MKFYNDCYRVVRKKCFKFIKSQETSKEKFKNKEKMIRDYLIQFLFGYQKNVNLNPIILDLQVAKELGKPQYHQFLKLY